MLTTISFIDDNYHKTDVLTNSGIMNSNNDEINYYGQ